MRREVYFKGILNFCLLFKTFISSSQDSYFSWRLYKAIIEKLLEKATVAVYNTTLLCFYSLTLECQV